LASTELPERGDAAADRLESVEAEWRYELMSRSLAKTIQPLLAGECVSEDDAVVAVAIPAKSRDITTSLRTPRA